MGTAAVVEDTIRVVLTCLPAPPFRTTGSSRPYQSTSGGGGGGDRISRLSDAVLSNIVARLPAKDAARTTALSRRWRRVWASTPLVLDDSDLLVFHDDGGCSTPNWLAVTDTVSHVLSSHRGPIRFVRLTCCYMALAAHNGALQYWLRILAAGGVEDLVLVNRPLPTSVSLPVDVLHLASLRTLYLGFWCFPDTAALPRGRATVFPCLQEIGLCATVIHARDIDHLLACSPVLEKFASITSIYFTDPVRIRSCSLRCLVFWESLANELDLVVAPHLQRLILWQSRQWMIGSVHFRSRIRIGSATELKVLGYLEPSIHQLEIGGTIIDSGTKMTPSNMVPSVKILALKMQFRIRKEVKMLPTFLRCFPNVETLHVLSHETDEQNGKFNLKFWEEVGSISCLETRITKVVFDKFRGERCELAFLKFVLERAESLLKLVVVLANGDQASVDEMLAKLKSLTTVKRASDFPTLLAVAREGDSAWYFERASDLSVTDPFNL